MVDTFQGVRGHTVDFDNGFFHIRKNGQIWFGVSKHAVLSFNLVYFTEYSLVRLQLMDMSTSINIAIENEDVEEFIKWLTIRAARVEDL